MLCSKVLTLVFVLVWEMAYCASNRTDDVVSSASCSYIFRVKREDGCSVNDGALTQLQTTVNELQQQVTLLLQQNTQVLQDNAYWRRIAQETADSSSSNRADGGETGVGSVFTRWGRTECSQNSSLVYKGYAAGSHFTHTGGSSEFLCLPEEPQWGRYVSGLQRQSYVYGAEYQTGEYQGNGIFLGTNDGGLGLYNNDVPCVVCYISGRSTVKTFPAMVQCPDGWSLEYHGYLMAGRHTHKAHIKPVCLDEAPEVAESGSADLDGALFYHLEARCGSLPCPNYVEGRELTCAVCSR